MTIRLFNTLTRQKEPLEPIEPGKLKMYHCGPTVYSSPHIGNFRSFLLADLMRRFFEDQGFDVHQVMNITDVGHMTDDDEDAGEDKMGVAARKLKKDPWEIAKMYEGEFRDCLAALNFRMPHELPRATDHIPEMGAIIQELLEFSRVREPEHEWATREVSHWSISQVRTASLPSGPRAPAASVKEGRGTE